VARKNPQAAIEAFKRWFPAGQRREAGAEVDQRREPS
jgi:hypothetical protein